MMCEAERRNRQALFAITIQKGNGEWCLADIERILKGECECTTNQPKEN